MGRHTRAEAADHASEVESSRGVNVPHKVSFEVEETGKSVRASITGQPGILVPVLVWPYSHGMATTTVKSTYALDVETVRALEDVARGWGVSKSEALRRAIRAAKRESVAVSPDALAALDALQRSLGLESLTAAGWEKKTRAERRSASMRRESR